MFVPNLITTYNLQRFSERKRAKKIERFVSFEKWSSKDKSTALCLEYIVEEYTEYEEALKRKEELLKMVILLVVLLYDFVQK